MLTTSLFLFFFFIINCVSSSWLSWVSLKRALVKFDGRIGLTSSLGVTKNRNGWKVLPKYYSTYMKKKKKKKFYSAHQRQQLNPDNYYYYYYITTGFEKWDGTIVCILFFFFRKQVRKSAWKVQQLLLLFCQVQTSLSPATAFFFFFFFFFFFLQRLLATMDLLLWFFGTRVNRASRCFCCWRDFVSIGGGFIYRPFTQQALPSRGGNPPPIYPLISSLCSIISSLRLPVLLVYRLCITSNHQPMTFKFQASRPKNSCLLLLLFSKKYSTSITYASTPRRKISHCFFFLLRQALLSFSRRHDYYKWETSKFSVGSPTSIAAISFWLDPTRL